MRVHSIACRSSTNTNECMCAKSHISRPQYTGRSVLTCTNCINLSRLTDFEPHRAICFPNHQHNVVPLGDQYAQPNELTECHLLCPHMYRHFLSRPRHCRQREIVPSRTTSNCGQRWNRCKSRCRRWPRPPWVKARSVTLYFRAQCSRVRVYFLCRCRGLNRRE